MVSHKSKYLSITLLIFVIFTFFAYLLLLYYVFRIKTPKLFGVILLSLLRAIEHRFKYASVSQRGGCEDVFRWVVRLFIKHRYFFNRKEF